MLGDRCWAYEVLKASDAAVNTNMGLRLFILIVSLVTMIKMRTLGSFKWNGHSPG